MTMIIDGTNGAFFASWTTATRPSVPVAGQMGYNTTTNAFEGYNGSAWSPVGGAATGGGSNQIFVLNEQTVTVDYTLAATNNASSAGPITIATGVNVILTTGSNWVII